MGLSVWEYRATVERVIDGDTQVYVIDCGFRVYTRVHLRLSGVDAPEAHTDAGAAAAAWLAEWMPPGSPVVVATELDRSFNRYLAAVTYGGRDVARALVDAGHATVSTE